MRKEITTISPKSLSDELEKIQQSISILTTKFIEAGRGQERITEIRNKTDEMSVNYIALLDYENDIYNEVNRRYEYHGSLKRINATLNKIS